MKEKTITHRSVQKLSVEGSTEFRILTNRHYESVVSGLQIEHRVQKD